MIPHLNDLPPLMEEEHPLKKLVRPLLRTLLLVGCLGGCVWFFNKGLEKMAYEEMNITGGLRAVAEDLWSTGSAREIRSVDPDLITELARLRKRVVSDLAIVVVAAENEPGKPLASHDLIYLQAQRKVLVVRVFFHQTEGKVEVLSYQTNPDFLEKPAVR